MSVDITALFKAFDKCMITSHAFRKLCELDSICCFERIEENYSYNVYEVTMNDENETKIKLYVK